MMEAYIDIDVHSAANSIVAAEELPYGQIVQPDKKDQTNQT